MGKRMSPAAIRAMNLKRFGRRGRKPTKREIEQSILRQAPRKSESENNDKEAAHSFNFDDPLDL